MNNSRTISNIKMELIKVICDNLINNLFKTIDIQLRIIKKKQFAKHVLNKNAYKKITLSRTLARTSQINRE